MASQYKTFNFKFYNNEADERKLIEIREKINSRQNSSNSTLFNIILSIAGFFGVTLGITSAVFSGAISSNSAYLEKLEDAVTKIYTEFTRPGSSEYVTYAIITLKFKATGVNAMNQILWKAEDPTYKWSNPIIGPSN